MEQIDLQDVLCSNITFKEAVLKVYTPAQTHSSAYVNFSTNVKLSHFAKYVLMNCLSDRKLSLQALQ